MSVVDGTAGRSTGDLLAAAQTAPKAAMTQAKVQELVRRLLAAWGPSEVRPWSAGRSELWRLPRTSTRCGAARLHHALADQRAIETSPARHWADPVPQQPQPVPASLGPARPCATAAERSSASARHDP